MQNRLWKYVVGYVNICVSGSNAKRFINICAQRRIYIGELEACEEGFRLMTDIGGYFQMKDVARKTGCIPHILTKGGLPFYIHIRRKRIFFPLGIILTALLILAANSFVWDVRIGGNIMIPEAEITAFLDEIGVRKGMIKYFFDEDRIAKEFVMSRNDVIWADFSVKGTVATLEIAEREMPPEVLDAEKSVGIYAAKDGLIVKMTVKAGTPQVNTGDTVYMGQMLVDCMTPEGKRVHALADITARVWYEYRENIRGGEPEAEELAVFLAEKRMNEELGGGEYEIIRHEKVLNEDGSAYILILVERTENIAQEVEIGDY